MGLVFLTLIAVLAFAIWRAEAKDTRMFLAVCLAVNVVALFAVIVSMGPAGFHLQENPWNTCGDNCF